MFVLHLDIFTKNKLAVQENFSSFFFPPLSPYVYLSFFPYDDLPHHELSTTARAIYSLGDVSGMKPSSLVGSTRVLTSWPTSHHVGAAAPTSPPSSRR